MHFSEDGGSYQVLAKALVLWCFVCLVPYHPAFVLFIVKAAGNTTAKTATVRGAAAKARPSLAQISFHVFLAATNHLEARAKIHSREPFTAQGH